MLVTPLMPGTSVMFSPEACDTTIGDQIAKSRPQTTAAQETPNRGKRGKSIVIDFKGGEGSVYSEIAPIFNVKL